jgi:hypothetical protein
VKAPGNRRTDAASGAGHERELSGQVQCHACPLRIR